MKMERPSVVEKQSLQEKYAISNVAIFKTYDTNLYNLSNNENFLMVSKLDFSGNKILSGTILKQV